VNDVDSDRLQVWVVVRRIIVTVVFAILQFAGWQIGIFMDRIVAVGVLLVPSADED